MYLEKTHRRVLMEEMKVQMYTVLMENFQNVIFQRQVIPALLIQLDSNPVTYWRDSDWLQKRYFQSKPHKYSYFLNHLLQWKLALPCNSVAVNHQIQFSEDFVYKMKHLFFYFETWQIITCLTTGITMFSQNVIFHLHWQLRPYILGNLQSCSSCITKEKYIFSFIIINTGYINLCAIAGDKGKRAEK